MLVVAVSSGMLAVPASSDITTRDLPSPIEDEMHVVQIRIPSVATDELSKQKSEPGTRIHFPNLVRKLEKMHRRTDDATYATTAINRDINLPPPLLARREPEPFMAKVNEDVATFLAQARTARPTQSIFIREDRSVAYPRRGERSTTIAEDSSPTLAKTKNRTPTSSTRLRRRCEATSSSGRRLIL